MLFDSLFLIIFQLKEAGGTIHVGYRDSSWGAFEGDKVIFDELTDEFSVVSSDNVVRTYFKPDPSKHGFKTNLEYFEKNF